MSYQDSTLMRLADELRRAFDHSFSQAPVDDSVPTEAFLAIGAGASLYALRLAEISGLHADKKIVPLPTESTDLLGLTSFRGVLVPTYDLPTLLGYSAKVKEMPRWLVLMQSKTPVALAFEQFDGYFSVPRDVIAPDASRERRQRYIAEAVRFAEQLRPIVSLNSILESIRERAQPRVSQRGK